MLVQRKKEGNNRNKNVANFSKEDNNQLFYSCMNVVQKLKDIWYLDNDYSNHLISDQKTFVELDKTSHLMWNLVIKKNEN